MLKIDSVVLCLPVNVPEHLFTDSFRLKKNANCHDQGYEVFFKSANHPSIFIYKYTLYKDT